MKNILKSGPGDGAIHRNGAYATPEPDSGEMDIQASEWLYYTMATSIPSGLPVIMVEESTISINLVEFNSPVNDPG